MLTKKLKQALIASMLFVSPIAMAEAPVEPVEAAQAATATVNINSADAATLAEQLRGIGLVKAEAIVAYRAEFGPFSSASDLAKVKGIGEKTVEKIADQLTF